MDHFKIIVPVTLQHSSLSKSILREIFPVFYWVDFTEHPEVAENID